MANNYTQGATLVHAASLVPDGAAAAVAIVNDRVTRGGSDDHAWQDFTLKVEDWNGDLYIGSNESLNEDDLVRLFKAITNAKLLTKSIDIEFSSWCDKLRPGEFSGAYARVLPDGEILWFGTGLGDLTDDQLRRLVGIRESPDIA